MQKIPNILTALRIVLSVVLLFTIVHMHNFFPWIDASWLNLLYGIIFGIAGLTDFFDGYIARNFDVKSRFGEIADPLADKMLVLSAFIGLIILHRVSVWPIFIILSREFYVAGLRTIVANASVDISLAASTLGKYKTTLQIVSIVLLLLDYILIGNILLWIAVGITLYSGYTYTKSYYRYL